MSDHIPEEVMTQILTRLPSKSLMRFRCVSKSWKSLISSSHFVSMHTRQAFLSTPAERMLIRHYSKAQKNEIYSIYHESEEFSEANSVKIGFPFRGLSRFYFRVVGSCNGLLCLSDDIFSYTNVIMLWNPLIRRKITLPLPRATFNNLGPYAFVLGFGYDVKNSDFKVVRVAYVQGDDGYNLPPIVEVYSLSVGNWREISNNLPQNWVLEYVWMQAFVNGKVHWTAYRKNVGRKGGMENLIMAFDISEEVFEEILLPNALVYECPINMSAAVYRRSLAVMQYDRRGWSRRCSIWVMEDYGDSKSWSKMFDVSVDGWFRAVLGFKKDDDILLASCNNELVSYDPRSDETVKLSNFGTGGSFYMDTYAESLALLDEGEQELAGRPSADEPDSSEEESEGEVGSVERTELMKLSLMIQFLYALLERQCL